MQCCIKEAAAVGPYSDGPPGWCSGCTLCGVEVEW